MVNFVLVMSVNPGFGGQQFLPLAVEKIAYLAALRKEMGLNFRIEVDGGVALEPSPPSSRPERNCSSQAPPSSRKAAPSRTRPSCCASPAPRPRPVSAAVS